jgi:hypothetical protein
MMMLMMIMMLMMTMMMMMMMMMSPHLGIEGLVALDADGEGGVAGLGGGRRER